MENIKYFFKSRDGFILKIIILLVIGIGLINPNFLSIDNLSGIILNNIILGILALGMTVIILTSGIDVSIGSQLGFVAVSLSLVSTGFFSNPLYVILFSIICGIFLGLVNGVLISIAEIPPIVATLGTLSIYRGAILMKTNGKWVTTLPEWLKSLYNYQILGVKIPIIVFITMVFITHYLLKHQKIGREIYAYGGNKIASSRAGVNSNKINIFVFCFMGAMIGIASLLYVSQLGMIEPNAGTNMEMMVIAAVIIGGTSIFGGSGSVLGTILGVLILSILQNAMVLTRIETYWQDVVMGAIIIATVCLDMHKKAKIEENKAIIEVDGEVK